MKRLPHPGPACPSAPSGVGGKLALCARGGRALQEAVQAIERNAPGAEVLALAGDVSDSAFADRLVEEALRRFGRVDVLVNNASILGPSPQPTLAAYPLGVLRRVYAVNVMAPLQLIQRVLPSMLEHGSGVILNITSDAARAGYPGWGATARGRRRSS